MRKRISSTIWNLNIMINNHTQSLPFSRDSIFVLCHCHCDCDCDCQTSSTLIDEIYVVVFSVTLGPHHPVVRISRCGRGMTRCRVAFACDWTIPWTWVRFSVWAEHFVLSLSSRFVSSVNLFEPRQIRSNFTRPHQTRPSFRISFRVMLDDSGWTRPLSGSRWELSTFGV